MLSQKIWGLDFKMPILMASGCFGFGLNYKAVFDPNFLGGFSLKGLSTQPMKGNQGVRFYQYPSGMINSIGLENPGLNSFLEKQYPILERFIDVPVFANLHGNSEEEFISLVETLSPLEKISAFEINISCPNVSHHGKCFHEDVDSCALLIKTLVGKTKKPIIVKLSPNFGNIPQMALALAKAGASGFSLVNTFLGSAVDIYSGQFVLERINGGYSGEAIFPLVLKIVGEVYALLKKEGYELPIIAMGGVRNFEQALALTMAGASLVAIGSGIFENEMLPLEIRDDIERFLQERKIASFKDIVGIAHNGGLLSVPKTQVEEIFES